METIKEVMDKSLTAIKQESKTIPVPAFNFDKLKELAVQTNPVFESAVMDSDNEQPMREIFNLLYQPKGILIIGTIGSGKTYLMEFFSAAMAQVQKGFTIIPAHWVIRDCLANMALIDSYGRKSFSTTSGKGTMDYKKPRTICFDDIGMEAAETKVYGNSISVLTEILFDRHILFNKYGMKTHATSNLSVDSLSEKYLDRAASRFREMFNVVTITSKDRRK